jgi:hypothetical protein
MLVGLVALLAGYVRFQALDEETFRGTASELIADDEIRNQVAATLVDELYANVDVAAAVADRLPPEQQGLAAPLAGAFRELTDRAAVRLLDRPEAQELWLDAVTFSHQELLRVLKDEAPSIQSEEGAVFLDLGPLIVALGDRVDLVSRLAERLPDDAGRIKVVEGDQLETAQDITRLLDVLGLWLWVVPLALGAAALWLARGERRIILRWIGVTAILMGLIVLLVRRVVGEYVVDATAQTSAVEAAARDAWSILTDLLVDGALTVIGIGVILLVAAWLGGESSSARAARTELAPFLARPELAYGAAFVLFVALLLWSPTAQTTRVPQMIAAAVLLAIGVEVLRRQAAKEHPDARADDLGAYARERWASMRGKPV